MNRSTCLSLVSTHFFPMIGKPTRSFSNDWKTLLVTFLFLVAGGRTVLGDAGLWKEFMILNSNGSGNVYYDMNFASANPDFHGANLGSFGGTNRLILTGAEANTWQDESYADWKITNYFRVCLTNAAGSTFSYQFLPWQADTGGNNNKQWFETNSAVDLLLTNGVARPSGTYYLEVYTLGRVSWDMSTWFDRMDNNNGTNYLATFTILPPGAEQSPTNLSFSYTLGSGTISTQSFSVMNSGGGLLGYTVTNIPAWLSVTPANNSGPLSPGSATVHRVSFFTNGLVEGVSNAQLYIASAEATNMPRVVTVSLNISATPVPPSAPASVWASATNLTSFTADWTASSGATNYQLDVSGVNNFASYIAGYQDRRAGDATSAAVTGLLENTAYYFRVRAQNAVGTSGNSATQSVTTTTTPFNPGNSWHYPTNAEPPGAFMRNPPTNGAPPSSGVYIYNGTWTNESNQTGGMLYYRLVGGSWTQKNLSWDSDQAGGNQYWVAAITAATFSDGDQVEYYLGITYANADTTYLGSVDNLGSVKYALASVAATNTFKFTYGAGSQNLGNCWHIPANAEPSGAYMRNPRNPYANNEVYIYNGNQFQGAGNPGNQTGGALNFRKQGAAFWDGTTLAFDSQVDNNKYWYGRIDANYFSKTNVIEYYLEIPYSDHDMTYLGTTNGGLTSTTFAQLTNAAAHPFTFTYGGDSGAEAAFIWHNTNRVNFGGGSVQFWTKIGYAQGIGTNRWVDYGCLYYTTNGVDPSGTTGSVLNASTMVQAMQFDHMEEDTYPDGDAMWWAGILTNLPSSDGSVIKYKIGAWKAGGVERFAEYNTSGQDNSIFSFSLFVSGAQGLTVDGISADYTTTKFFIDEITGETQRISVVYVPESGASNVQVYCNLNRRDLCDVDYTNAFIQGDGHPDGIRPPDGNLIGASDTGAYFTAFAMSGGPTTFYWTGVVSRCGAYRLTARYQKNATGPTDWKWYSSPGGLRDHAIVVSPRKVHALTMYELNTLTVEATDNTETGRSTFRDLLSTNDVDGDPGPYDPFNLDYLNHIQANCLWFQPIHPTAEERKDVYTPGSPYATRNYFAVSKWFGAQTNEASAMTEFTNFVGHCDRYPGTVGTVNVMLDGVFNHTSWDAVFGEAGVTFGYCTNANDRIGWFKPGWYANWQDYGESATYYQSAYSNDIATAPDRGDFGKWPDVAELYFGKYSALVRHNPENDGDYLNEGDTYDFTGMATNTMQLWKFFAYYPEYWIKKTGHSGSNTWTQALDDRGIDGLRCDFGQGLPPQCWEYIINRTRHMKWNFIFMAETLDGGKPGYRSNRHFDVLNENLVFKFTQERINDSWAVKQALEDRRSAYRGGSVLLNLTSHDEVLPGNDCWMVASRYGAVSSVDGIPMMFYGQEQGIQNWQGSVTKNTGFKTAHEENFGKFIPNFKQWNKLTVWEETPDFGGEQLAQWYGRVNWARLNSPALRSVNRYFLSNLSGGDNSRILAVAKYQTAYAAPTNSDVVLAFSLILRNDEGSHVGASETYDLKGAWSILGLDTNKLYNAKNIASSDATGTWVWPAAKTGTELWNDGLWVNLPADTTGNITNDGALVQYLKIYEVTGQTNRGPQITFTPPGPFVWPVGSVSNLAILVTDPDGNPVTTNVTVAPAGAVFSNGLLTWPVPSAFENTTNLVRVVADDQQGQTNSVVTNSTTITVPFDWNGNGIGDGWEWDNFSNLTNGAAGDNDGDQAGNWEEYIAGTEPTNRNSYFAVSNLAQSIGLTNRLLRFVTQQGRRYTVFYADMNFTNNVDWLKFGNTNNGIGTWLETNASPSAYSFNDNQTAETTTNAPASGRRMYRIGVEKP
ncbi:MAG: fibronectin type III domain-containing protein [Lentisphaerota bacterium]